MKVLFVDIDGVLVTLASFKSYRKSGSNAQADPACVEQLNLIVGKTGASIVLSSTWRMFGRPYMDQKFTEWGVAATIMDFTPIIQTQDGDLTLSCSRGREIQTWLNNHPDVQSFAIVDDDDDMEHLTLRLVRTEFVTGLTVERADTIIRMLQ